MQHQESAGTDSLVLATAVREQSLHIAHTVIEGDPSHLDHYREWRQRVRSRIQKLGPTIPDSERARLQSLGDKTQRIHDVFVASLLPLIEKGDHEGARRVHRDLDAWGVQAASEADALARAIDARMHRSHRQATSAARTGLILGGVCVAAVLLLSGWFTLRLRAAVLEPLRRLTESVRRFGNGEFAARVGDLGNGEVGELGRVFDQMADELLVRERQLVRQERMAAIGQLAAGVAHELNNPIGIIRGYLKTMSPGDDPESLRQELKILDDEASHCQRIAEDLVSYARTSELEFGDVEVSDFLEESASRFLDKWEGQRPELVIEAEAAQLQIDRGRVRQVVFNLLRNAVEAAGEGASLRIAGSVIGRGYRIDFEDNGPGIPEADRALIFEPFFSRGKNGTGLGLAVVSGIVRAHGGTIEALEGGAGGGFVRVEFPLSGPPSSQRSVQQDQVT
jgi:signal transduction histidine kinase